MRDVNQRMIKLFEALDSAFPVAEVFRDFVEVSAIVLINQYAFDAEWEQREQRYHEIQQKYEEADFSRLSELLSILMLAIYEAKESGLFVDILGSLYMGLGLGKSASGQFFTPYEISKLMTALVAPYLEEELAKKPFISVMEPSCGSGTNFIAFAERVAGHGYSPTRNMAAVGVDLDILCVWMCFIQCQLYRIPAKIVHGNSLTHECWSAWCTLDWFAGGFGEAMKQRCQPTEQEDGKTALTLEEQLVLF
ncbi:MAG: N-6 DNA methylase [Neisseria sp.]|uniref:N-6 DNA methylase n=1 Tax=Neisseria sp. TaxID=192066 RepID=UPI0026DA7572|nr:N-6 DNA methylase [Neisseria sp.]MDO4641695.1 N-6 DNA methylase [Neisseria sp.]